jgi:hypothetical protein
MRLLLIIFITFGSGLTGCSYLSKKLVTGNMLSKNQMAVALIADRQIICAKAHVTQCGLMLSECLDGLEYKCTNNVIIFDLEKSISRSHSEGI